MAEISKRHNNPSGKAASKQPNLSVEQALATCVGARIRIQSENPHMQALEGTLFAACPKTSLLALSTGNLASQTHHVLPLSSLTGFSIIFLPSTPHQSVSLCQVNTASLLDRAEKALARAKEKAAKSNQAVGRETQGIFDALDKQFGSEWSGKDIVVMSRVLVKGPNCKEEDCTAYTKEAEGLLARVKKVVENERKRVLQRDGGKPFKPAVPIVPAVPAPQAPRKGG